MKRGIYRIKPFDMVNDIWMLQKRKLFIFWTTVGVGKYAELEKKIDEFNAV